MLFGRCIADAKSNDMKNYRNLLFSFVSAIALFLVFLCIGATWFGGVGPLITYVNGGSVYFPSKTLDLGNFEAGAETVAVFKMTNLSPLTGSRNVVECAPAVAVTLLFGGHTMAGIGH